MRRARTGGIGTLLLILSTFTPLLSPAAGEEARHETADDHTACNLLTKTEVEHILGETIARIAPVNGTRVGKGCIFISPARTSVSVYILTSPVAFDAQAEIRKTKEQVAATRVRDIAGLGEAAILTQYPGAVQVGVYAGRHCLMLSAYGVGPTPARSTAIENLARKALARVPDALPNDGN